MKKILLTALIFIFFITLNKAQDDALNKGLNSITPDAIKAQMGFLASDFTEGREAGEKGEYLAAEYISSILQLAGLKPGGDPATLRPGLINSGAGQKTWFQNFSLLKTVPEGSPVMFISDISGNTEKTVELAPDADFIVRYVTQSVEIKAPVVFIGYGFRNSKLNYNDFEKCEIKGKFVLRVSGIPSFARKALTPDEITSSQRESDSFIREQGAAGIIEFDPYSITAGNPPEKEFLKSSPAEERPTTGRPRARFIIPTSGPADNFITAVVASRVARELVKGSGFTIEDYLAKAEAGQAFSKPVLTGKNAVIKTSVSTTLVPVRNVLGVIEGRNPGEVIVVGAHYDHMGMGNGYVWNGADDNASGTVAVMTLARAAMMTGLKPEKTIVFALWTAEEEGLLGSRYYVRNPSYPISYIKLNMNFDMVSRYISDDNPKGVVMTFTKANPKFREVAEAGLKKYNIDLTVDYQASDDPPGGTDHRSFVEYKIPVIRFKPGHREEYHTPADELETIDWDIMEKIIRINFVTLWELANSKW